MIGLLSEDIATTPHAGRIILGAQDAARDAGLALVPVNTTQSPSDAARDVDTLLRQQVDGILYATMYHRVLELPAQLAHVPAVLGNSECASFHIPWTVPDEVGGAGKAVGELIEHGHRRIGFLKNSDTVPASQGRLRGYSEALSQAGITFDESMIVTRPSETPGGYEAAHVLLGRKDRPSALFCYNDRMAMGAYRAAAELGLRIPADISVVGFDNQEIVAEGLFPPLTTVALPHYEMGQWAMRRLIAMLNQPKDVVEHAAQSAILACPLVRRNSVSRPSSTVR